MLTKKFLRFFLAAFLILNLAGNSAFAALGPGSGGGPLTPNALCLDDADTWIFCDSTFTFGDTSARIAEGWFTTLNATTLTLGGASAGNIDLDGYNLIMNQDADDAFIGDRDATIADDEIGVQLNNALEAIFTTTAFQPATDGSIALGSTTLAFDGLYLNTGTSINWENGNVTLTHATGSLTLSDDDTFFYGTNTDWGFKYDETTTDALQLVEGTVGALAFKGSAFSTFIAAADTAGNDLYLALQNAGAHTSNNPSGANLYFKMGDLGSGGSGTFGHIYLLPAADASASRTTVNSSRFVQRGSAYDTDVAVDTWDSYWQVEPTSAATTSAVIRLYSSKNSAAGTQLVSFGSAGNITVTGSILSTTGAFSTSQGNGSATLTSTWNDGANTAIILDNNETLTNTGAKLLSVRNNTNEQFYVGINGELNIPSMDGVGSGLDINVTATTYTTALGSGIDIVRSGALTGVDTQTILDEQILPAFTLTEPGAGSVNYYGANIDMSGLGVTAGAGTSVVSALRLVADDDADTGTNYALLVDSGATKLDGDFIIGSKAIDTTAGDSATINAIAGRFRKDTSGTTFTLTNSFITANSIIQLTYASDPGATGYDMYVTAGAGTSTIAFETAGIAAAPAANTDVNFLIIN